MATADFFEKISFRLSTQGGYPITIQSKLLKNLICPEKNVVEEEHL